MAILGGNLDVSRGLINGASNISSYGRISTGGAVSNHLVWPQTGSPNIPVPASSGVQMTLVSTAAADDDGSTGINTVAVHYLDANLAPQVEIVTMNGTSGVTTTATDIRFIQCMHGVSFGSGGKAAGTITASNGGTTYSQISAGDRRCSSSARRVPAGKRLIITAMGGGAGSGTAAAVAEINLVATKIYDLDLSDDGITFPFMGMEMQDCSMMATNTSVAFGAGVIVAMEVTTDKAAVVTAGWSGWFEDDINY